EFGEALGAVPALQQESLARDDFGQRGLERARLAGEHERREVSEGRLGLGKRGRVSVHGQMPCLVPLPAVRCPSLAHVENSNASEGPRPYSSAAGHANVTSVIVSLPTSLINDPRRLPPLAAARQGASRRALRSTAQ